MRGWLMGLGLGVLVTVGAACGGQGISAEAGTMAVPAASPTPARQLPKFGSQAELDRLLADWKRRAEAERKNRRRGDGGTPLASVSVTGGAPPPAPAAPAPAAEAAADAGGGDAITNVQTAGVDEGGIVKKHGDFLVVLRRGRLFTLRVGGDALAPVSTVDAYAPGLQGGGWYDEMLISGDKIVVIGYSYARQGTEVGLFRIDRDGRLGYLDTWHLRSGDYYSSRNYASRLIGSTLVFYAPLRYSPWGAGELAYPGVSHWRGPDVPQDFKRLLPASDIYRADAGLDPLRDGVTLHTVTRCNLAVQPMACTATGVLGPSGREFYVSRDAVYVWTQRAPRGSDEPPVATVLRMPLDGGPVSALSARGAPIDQLSFLEDEGHLNVLLQTDGRGGAMWGAEQGAGRMALLRVPLSRFGDLRSQAQRADYRLLPEVPSGNRQNRYIGSWLVYGSAPWDGREAAGPLAYALRIDRNEPVLSLAPGHGVERIEALGNDAVLVGNRGDALVFSSVALSGDVLGVRDRYAMTGATQGERRTHGFFYRNDSAREGVIGLPVMRPGASPSRGFLGAPDGQAAVTYLRNADLRWTPLGELVSRPETRDDLCKASCVDWYGNARPIFLGPRVFALMGYELVEGQLRDGRIIERRRVDFSPAR